MHRRVDPTFWLTTWAVDHIIQTLRQTTKGAKHGTSTDRSRTDPGLTGHAAEHDRAHGHEHGVREHRHTGHGRGL